MNGLLAGVVKTRAAKRAFGFEHPFYAGQRQPRCGEQHETEATNGGIKGRLRRVQVFRRAFNGPDVIQPDPLRVLAHVDEHGAGYVHRNHRAT